MKTQPNESRWPLCSSAYPSQPALVPADAQPASTRDDRDLFDAMQPGSRHTRRHCMHPHPKPPTPATAAVLMIDGSDDLDAELLLHDADFPRYFTHMQHPQDYLVQHEPLTEYISHDNWRHSRLIARISWKKSDNEFIPMSFVCDTGAPMGFYLSQKAIDTLESIHRLCDDNDSGQKYVQIPGIGRAAVDQTPPGHAPANIMGLRVLRRVGLQLGRQEHGHGFTFLAAPSSW